MIKFAVQGQLWDERQIKLSGAFWPFIISSVCDGSLNVLESGTARRMVKVKPSPSRKVGRQPRKRAPSRRKRSLQHSLDRSTSQIVSDGPWVAATGSQLDREASRGAYPGWCINMGLKVPGLGQDEETMGRRSRLLDQEDKGTSGRACILAGDPGDISERKIWAFRPQLLVT